jgi:exodeoxyribonuclease VII large subunit
LGERPTFSVGELCDAVRLAFERSFPGELWVRGEIRDLKRPPSGHVYFDLVDPGELGRSSAAKISVALFANHKAIVNRILRKSGGAVRMTDGVEVRLRGQLQFHPPAGQLKLVMSLIDPAYTLGRLAADRDRLLRQLAAEGLLERNGSLPLSPAPLRIGLVTSAGSAAAHDFLEELRGSGLGFRVTCVDTRVQGAGAAESIGAALREAVRRGVDVVALVRGGGARTDLAVFDHEAVVRAVALAGVPVWTGIGHEIDAALADEVAHRSFKTPTACAAGLVERVASYLGEAEARWAAIVGVATTVLAREDAAIGAAAARLARDTHAALRLAEAGLGESRRRLGREAAIALRAADEGVVRRSALVGALDPARALARGWSITRDAAGRLVTDPAAVSPGDELVTEIAGGELRSTVRERG